MDRGSWVGGQICDHDWVRAFSHGVPNWLHWFNRPTVAPGRERHGRTEDGRVLGELLGFGSCLLKGLFGRCIVQTVDGIECVHVVVIFAGGFSTVVGVSEE